MTQDRLDKILKNRTKHKELCTLYTHLFESGRDFKLNRSLNDTLHIGGYVLDTEFLPEPLHVFMEQYQRKLSIAIYKLEEEFKLL